MAIGDQQWGKVVLACNFYSGFRDESAGGKVLTPSGNMLVSATQSRFSGGRSASFGGGGYVSIPRSVDFDFSTGDFTVEMFTCFTAHNSTAALVGNYQSSSTGWFFQWESGANTLQFVNGNSVLITVPWTPVNGQWYHLAICRAAGNLRLFVDGVQVGSTVAASADVSGSINALLLGALNDTGSYTKYFKGNIDHLRITKGVGRYTANFTAPASELPFYYAQIKGTVKDADGNFVRRIVRAHRRGSGVPVDEVLSNPSTGAYTLNCDDTSKHYVVVHDSDARRTYLSFDGENNSTQFPEWGGKTVSVYGNTRISTVHPDFGGAAAFFDGNGDYLTIEVENNIELFGADFTVRFPVWFDIIATAGLVAFGPIGAVPLLVYTTNGELRIYMSSAGIWDVASAVVFKTGLVANTKYDVEVCRIGSSIYAFCNGQLGATVNFGGVLAAMTGPLHIGSWAGSAFLAGHIGYLEIQNGVGLHAANFMPPTIQPSPPAPKNALIYDLLTPV